MVIDEHLPTLSLWRHSEANRGNSSRYRHIEGQGWYLDTREGLQGPFDSRPAAQAYLRHIIHDAHKTRGHRPPLKQR